MREAIAVGGLLIVVLGLSGCSKRAGESTAPVTPLVAAAPTTPAAAEPSPTTPVPAAATTTPPQTAGAAAVAALDDIPELPSYPGAERVKREIDVSGGEWAREAKIELLSTAGFDTVRAFYLEAIRANGWQVTGMKEEKDEIGWKLAKGASVAEIELDSEGFGRVKIKLERKDR